jgi:uncharacterized protein
LSRPDFERARQYAVDRLKLQLAPELTYHTIWHTCDDVVPAVERLAARECIRGGDLLLLKTAAYFHDIGFVERRVEHEAAGVGIARTVLPAFGYDEAALDMVDVMIMATRLPQNPPGALAAILADADLDVLGREDFWQRNELLRAELAVLDRPMSDEEWLRGQLRFLEQHRYWTAAARELRDSGKQAHIAELRALLATFPR